MHSVRILHVDDEPDIREVVEISLGLDPCFDVRSCGSGRDALTLAAEWAPHVILCDVMMPGMDGPETLARLRESTGTAKIPVIFMTARAQQRELEHFRVLGAAGVICKPFDPMTLAAEIRHQIREASMAVVSKDFADRMRSDAETLAAFRSEISDEMNGFAAVEKIKTIAHALAGASGIFGRNEIGNEAAMLEATSIKRLRGESKPGDLEHQLDTLLACIANQ
jgi:CheY-like chemotaxis protein